MDPRIVTLSLFLIAQAIGVIWWASGLTSEVSRLSGLADRSYASQLEIQRTISHLDLLLYQVNELTKDVEKLQESDVLLKKVDEEILIIHESLFERLINMVNLYTNLKLTNQVDPPSNIADLKVVAVATGMSTQ